MNTADKLVVLAGALILILASVGMALRNAKNKYLPEDANWTMYWNPPLGPFGLLGGKSVKTPAIDAKYTCYQEYCLYGDPAFNPYEPCNS
ncbi:MAG: hypothetical protein QHH19_01800 [Candidatus Thermoplasmatota archaeon]|nr:hypothetical protein [Candidatus Thermoplasmatota archaeon]